MSGLSNVVKGGWHPKGKEGSKESWRGDFKGINQVAGWMGKGKDPSSEKSEHVSQPLSSLKDPASFAPPPKHINYHGAAAVNETIPDRRGLGAPMSHEQIEEQNTRHRQMVEAEEEEAQKPKSPPVPYRANTTGLSTTNLPPPPVRRLDSPTSAPSVGAKPTVVKPKPQLPPRLPPRNQSLSQNLSPPPPYAAVTPSPSQGYVNQEAASRLANAGVSVPEIGIGGTSGTSSTTQANDSPVQDLQTHFSQMRTDSGSPNKGPPPPVPAPRPANSADFLPPAPGFRDRHADTIDAGKKKWGGVTSRFNTFVEDRKFSANANKRIPRPPGPNPPVRAPAPAPAAPAPPNSSSSSTLETQARKKPPPPPPKRAEMRAAPTMPGAFPEPESSSVPPPPVPHNTKPR
ncbi:uncharacterized protein N7484_002589 [Penicillium longicatenatum]|uniref:uncharacterized protein n=1 Tax=Penicillium longicatenatum TaxID=1561947 RepID=UPI002546769B|nr:uncharacterized protein N7484_002589 [Penicillium longicatenatum]KAJ5648866.1 hypothetical protein N7484_002589 [Penicillium longicatenatum]